MSCFTCGLIGFLIGLLVVGFLIYLFINLGIKVMIKKGYLAWNPPKKEK